MFVVQLVITSIIFLGLLMSNVLSVVLLAFFIFGDEHSNLQGADYYIVSLAISDLILGIFLLPVSLISLSMNQWTFGEEICAFYAYLWFSLWLINIYTFMLLSADRYRYLTDKKYCPYKNRTRCICEIVLVWSMALSFSFIPASLHSARLLTILVGNYVCTISWYEAVGYFAAIIIASAVPCLLCSIFNFTRIFYWRMQWKFQKSKRKLSGASIQNLLEPTHVVCLILFLIFWSSWIPFSVNIYGYLKSELQAPSVYYFWLGSSQGIWKCPVMLIFCPRYRQYFSNFNISKSTNVTVASNERPFNIECNSQPCSKQSHNIADDIELHM